MQRRGFLKSLFGVGAAVAVAPLAAMGSIKPEPEIVQPRGVYASGGGVVRLDGGELGRGSAPTYFRDFPMPRGY